MPTRLRGSARPTPAVWWPQSVVLTARGQVMLNPIYNQGSVSSGTRQLTRAQAQAHVTSKPMSSSTLCCPWTLLQAWFGIKVA